MDQSETSQSQDSQADSLPDLQLDTPYSDEVTEAMEAVARSRSDGNDGNETNVAENTTKESGSNGQSTEPAKQPREPEDKPAEPVREDKPKPSALANFHKQQQAFEDQRREFAKERAELEQFKRTIENAKTDRIAALEAMGYKDIKSFLEGLAEDGGRMTPERRELQEMRKWREKQEAQEADRERLANEQKSQAEMQRQLDAIRSDVQSRLKSDSFKNRLVNIQGADDQILAEMDRMASDSGEMPRIEDAIEAVEGRFRENLKMLSDNPEVRKHFQELLKSSQAAPSPSNSRGKISTIGSEVRTPGLAPTEEYVPSEDGEKEMLEALAFLNKKTAR